jgi:hypothetical protein
LKLNLENKTEQNFYNEDVSAKDACTAVVSSNQGNGFKVGMETGKG